MRAHADESRLAIQRAASVTFCEQGYHATTLEAIGARVGLTRGTVLHHFSSKAGLLNAVVGPYLSAMSELLATARVADPPTAVQRRRLVTQLAGLFLEHDLAVRLLASDVSARVQIGLVDLWTLPSERLVALLLGSRHTAHGRTKVIAALGAMVLPVTRVDHEMSAGPTRTELVEAALAVLERGDRPPRHRPAARAKTVASVPVRSALAATR